MLSIFSTAKNYIFIGLVVVLAVAAGWQFYRATSLSNDLVRAESDLKTANDNLNLAIEANKTNQGTIDQLQLEKRSVELALKNLEDARRRDAAVINTLSATIREQAKDPANQVTLSPVLKQTVAQIQAERARRAGGAK